MKRISNTGVECVSVLAGLHGKHADTQQILHAYALDKNKEPDSRTIIRIARDLKLKAQRVSVSQKKIDKVPLPAIVKLTGGTYGILAKKDPGSGGWLFLDPVKNKPELLKNISWVQLSQEK